MRFLFLLMLLNGCGGGGGAQAPAAPLVIEMYGESTFSGYGLQAGESVPALVQQLLPEASVVSRAVGSTTAQQQFTGTDGLNLPWRQQLEQSKASVIVINRGINDAYRNMPVAEFRSILTALVTQAQQAGKKVILQTPNATAYGDATDQAVAENAAIVREVGAALGVPVSDAHAMPVDVLDGVHPGKTLRAAMAGDIVRLVRGVR